MELRKIAEEIREAVEEKKEEPKSKLYRGNPYLLYEGP